MNRDKIKEFEFKTDKYHLISYFTLMGHRVGYLGMSSEKYKTIEGDNITVHGGVTFERKLHDEPMDMYIGFDCAHASDSIDKLTTKKLFPEAYEQYLSLGMFNFMTGSVKDRYFVIKWIFAMLKQIQKHKITEYEDTLLFNYCKENDNWGFYYRWIVADTLTDDELLFVKLNNLDYY